MRIIVNAGEKIRIWFSKTTEFVVFIQIQDCMKNNDPSIPPGVVTIINFPSPLLLLSTFQYYEWLMKLNVMGNYIYKKNNEGSVNEIVS